MYSAKRGRANANKKKNNPMPDLRAILEAVRTTFSAWSDFSPSWARALEYKFVVATLRNANRYTDPSMNVVAG